MTSQEREDMMLPVPDTDLARDSSTTRALQSPDLRLYDHRLYHDVDERNRMLRRSGLLVNLDGAVVHNPAELPVDPSDLRAVCCDFVVMHLRIVSGDHLDDAPCSVIVVKND